jgi:hypothetical protein
MSRIKPMKRWPVLLAVVVVLGLAAACTPRPFAASSPWNSPLGNVGWRDVPALRSGHSWVNLDEFSAPVAYGGDADPMVAVNVPASWGWPATTLQVRIPFGAVGGTGSDGVLVVVDRGIVYDFYQYRPTGYNTATVSSWAATAFDGSGWGSASPFRAAGVRAAGASWLGGLIQGGDFTGNGDFRHALAVSLQGGNLGGFVPPAIAGEGGGGAVPVGGRIGIPAGSPMPGGLSDAGVRMWNTLVRYGAYVVDQHGGGSPVVFYADPRSVGRGSIDPLRNNGGDLDKIMPYVRVVA